MKDRVVSCLEKSCERLDISLFYNTEDMRQKALGIRIFSCTDEDKARKLLIRTEEEFQTKQDIISLSYLLLAAKELGQTKSDMEDYIELLEDQRKRGVWSDQIWLNSLVTKALGKYGISYPNMVDIFLKERLPNGSWYEKVWVSAYALQGLFYSHADPSELSPTADFLKSAISGDHWERERMEKGWIDKEKVTALALESLLLVGEGYTEEPIKSSLEWAIEKINSLEDDRKIIDLAAPLTYVIEGKARKETSYRRADVVEFRETKVEIGEKIEGHKVGGDLIEGDKVDEKLAEGTTQLKDSIALRSNIGGDEEGGKTKMKDSIALKSNIGRGSEEVEDSIIRRIAEKEESLTLNYSVFTGEKIDGKVKYCPKCGKEVNDRWKHCPGCGYDMKKIREIFE